MANKVEIANFALARLGAERIYSIDDSDSENARLVALHIDQTIKAVLRAHPWNCCTKRSTLARLADAPAFEFAYAFQLPNNFLRASYVNDINALDNRDKWKIERDTLLSDDVSIQLVYVYWEEDAEKYDELLVEAISVKLAAKLAAPITGNPSSGANLLEEYETITHRLAARVDASEDSSNENHPLERHLSRSLMTKQRREHSW